MKCALIVLVAIGVVVFRSTPTEGQTDFRPDTGSQPARNLEQAVTRAREALAEGFLLGMGESSVMSSITDVQMTGCVLRILRASEGIPGVLPDVEELWVPLRSRVGLSRGSLAIAPLPTGESTGSWLEIAARDVGLRMFVWGSPEVASAKTERLEFYVRDLVRLCRGEIVAIE